MFHDTRRFAITNLAAAGVPDVIARSISRHRVASVHVRSCITPETLKRQALMVADQLVKAGRGS